MMVLSDLFKIVSLETSDNGCTAVLSPCRESEVYKGHFPDKPITPGVLMIKGAVELMERVSGKHLTLHEVKNIKYLSLMTPDDVEGCTLEAKMDADGILSATYKKDDAIFAKMKLLLTRNT